MLRVLILGIVGLTVFFRSVNGQDSDSLPPQAAHLIEAGPREWFGGTRNAIVAALGRPDSTVVQTVPNRHHAAAVDSIVRLRYPEAAFVLYGKDLLFEVTIWGPRYLHHSPLKLGATAPAVRRFFHDPSSGSTPHMTYSSGSLVPHTLELWFENDRLMRMEWRYTID
jgi:hypothetical protein